MNRKKPLLETFVRIGGYRLNENAGQTMKELGDLIALINDKSFYDDVQAAVEALGPGKTSGIVKSISTLYNKLNKLSDAGYKIRKKK